MQARMNKSVIKGWSRLMLCYWLVMAAVFVMEFRYMDSDWAGLPGFVLTMPLSTVVVTVFLLPAIAARFGYEIKINMTGYQAEFGFMLCAFLNAVVLYPFYAWWTNRKRKEFEAPPAPGLELRHIQDSEHA
jgi:hypothetical protein